MGPGMTDGLSRKPLSVSVLYEGLRAQTGFEVTVPLYHGNDRDGGIICIQLANKS